MKFFTAAFSLMIALSFSSLAVAEEADAHIHVHCDHLLHKDLTDAEKEYTTQAIVLAYNNIHALADGGDIYMSNPHWEDESALLGLGLAFTNFETEVETGTASTTVTGADEVYVSCRACYCRVEMFPFHLIRSNDCFPMRTDMPLLLLPLRSATPTSADETDNLGYYQYWKADWWYFSSWRCGNLCYNGLDE